ncbi:MAG: hypothetical protein JW864_06680 [Spirochaetes bacterium]|nr:hypothetical protein [Spirochaetota bacterium]
MTESKHSRYILSELRRDSHDDLLPPGIDPIIVSNTKSHKKMLSLDDSILKGSFYTEIVWIWPGGSEIYPETAEPNSHSHNYDEIVAFVGTDFNNPNDLCGEIELWMEDEKFMLTSSCLIFIPKGMYHCPLVIHKVEKPIFHFAAGPGPLYMQKIKKR